MWQPAKIARIFCDRKLIDPLVKRGGYFSEGLAHYVSSNTKPIYKRYAGQAARHHRAAHFRRLPLCEQCGAPHVTKTYNAPKKNEVIYMEYSGFI